MLKKETLNLLNSTKLNFKSIFTISIGKNFLFQKRFINSLGEYKNWSTNIKEGTLKLDDKTYNVEYIGTTSKEDPYWYSANVEKMIPDEYKKLIIESKKNIEKLNFNKLNDDEIYIFDFINGYNLSMIYMAFAPENTAYFCGSGNTSIYMFVKNLPENIFEKIRPEEFTTTIMEIISEFDVDHKLLIKTILIENDIEYTETEKNIIAKFNNNSNITINFNDKELIENFSGNLK